MTAFIWLLIHMAPSLEAMGIRMMFNECEPIVRQGQRIFLAGVDDPHFYRADDIEKAAAQIPSDAFQFYWRTRQKFTNARRAPDSILCFVGTLTGASFACPAGCDQAGGGSTTINGRRRMAPRRSDRIHVGQRWYELTAGTLELSARNHLAHPATCKVDQS